jgi:acetylglutamate kinase
MERFELVIRFLREIGAAREAEMYLRLFRRAEPHRFAVIAVEPDLSSLSRNLLALHFSFLSALDLHPVVIHGPGTPGTDADEEETSSSRRVQGNLWRWLNAEPGADWQAIRDATLAFSETLAASIILHGGDVEPLVSGVFRDENGPPRIEPIRRAVRRKAIPIVAALTAPAKGAARLRSLRPLPLAEALEALVNRLRPARILRISEDGGLRTADGRLIDYLNLKLSHEYLDAADALTEATREDIEGIRSLLRHLPLRSMIQITSAGNLLKELFTQKGGGTLVKPGRALKVHDDLTGLSRTRLRRLIEAAFGRKLSRGYFQKGFGRKAPIRTIVVDPDYKGLGIVRRIEDLDYLDKFAVRPEARGEGIALDLWTILKTRHPAIFWRSRPNNPINNWYYEHSDGVMKFDQWHVWWRGLEEDEIRRAARLAQAIEPTLR